MTYDLVSVNGLGAAMELGLVQTGAHLLFRTGKLDLGAPVVRGNRKLLGWDWDDQFSPDHRDWELMHGAHVVSANCPCSGFSTLTAKQNRGINAKVNVHLWDLVKYASRLDPAPLIIVNESVQQAWSGGLELMRAMRDYVVEQTGHHYTLYHILQSNASLGGASLRKRYFWLISRVPFGVEYAQPARVAKLGDALRDLEGLDITPHKQPYRRPATWWSVARRAADGVDGHFHGKQSKTDAKMRRLLESLRQAGLEWIIGEPVSASLKRLYLATGEIPQEWNLEKLVTKDFWLGVQQTGRWDPTKQSNVITGAGPDSSVHYAEPRLFTHRECARVQGFPDTWRIEPAKDYTHLGLVWGKGVPVDAGRWIGTWINSSLNGEPGTVRGKKVPGEDEYVIDITHAYKHTLGRERAWEHQAAVPHEHVDHDEDHRCDTGLLYP